MKDVNLTEAEYCTVYYTIIHYMRKLFHDAELVHADLSEFNILYYKKQVYIIDVSQSVEFDHPRALDFLKMDCKNVTDFFRRMKVNPLSVQELFNIITSRSITEETLDNAIEEARIKCQNISKEEQDTQDEIFMNTYIPRSLNEIKEYEKDYEKIKSGQTEGIYHLGITGLDTEVNNNDEKSEEEEDDDESESSVSEIDEEELEIIDNILQDTNKPFNNANNEEIEFKIKTATKEMKKLHKKMVKEQNREKRENKIPKKDRKRAKVLSSKKHK